MKKGILSSILIVFVLFLASATVLQSRVPIQELKTISEVEAIRNFEFNGQIARDFADKAFAEALYDSFLDNACATPAQADVEDKYNIYLAPIGVNFGLCSIVNPITTADPITVTYNPGPNTFTTDIAVLCESKSTVPKQITYKKNYSFEKSIEILVPDPCNELSANIIDEDSGLKDISPP